MTAKHRQTETRVNTPRISKGKEEGEREGERERGEGGKDKRKKTKPYFGKARKYLKIKINKK